MSDANFVVTVPLKPKTESRVKQVLRSLRVTLREVIESNKNLLQLLSDQLEEAKKEEAREPR